MLKANNRQLKMPPANFRRDLGKSDAFEDLDKADSDYESLNISKISE